MKKLMLAMTLVALAGCSRFHTTDARIGEGQMTTAVTVQPSTSIAALKGYKFGDSVKPLLAVEAEVRAALNSPDGGHAIAAQLCTLLGPDSTRDAKDFACRQLWFVASEDNIGAIAPLLSNADTSDMARYALEKVSSDDVDDALIDALATAPDSAKIGIINSLVARGNGEGIKAVKQQAKSGSPEVAAAAKAALAGH